MRIWLDDVRTMPEGFDVRCTNCQHAVTWILTGNVTHISFDHDLGDVLNGYWLASYIETGAADGKIPPLTWDIHSANPEGRRYIEMAMKSAERFWNKES